MDAYDFPLDMPTCSTCEPRFSREYAQVLVHVSDRAVALAEIRLFRFWLSTCAQHQGLPTELIRWPIHAIHALPHDVDGINIAATLGRPLDQLMKSRFQLYTRFFLDGRHADDPLGLRAAALALACQLCIQPPPIMRRLLEQNTHHHFFNAQARVQQHTVTTHSVSA